MRMNQILSAKLSQKTDGVFPVIIYAKGNISEIRGCISEHYGRIKYELPFINAAAVEISRERLLEVARYQTIRLIADDALVTKASLNTVASLDTVNSLNTKARAASTPPPRRVYLSGYTTRQKRKQDSHFYKRRGQGVGIAVVDTGISPHYDLIYPENRITAFKDFINNRAFPYDDDGHGTHVSGILAGNGYASQKYIGSAPYADLISIKALDSDGNGSTSDILASFQWILDHRKLYNIRVINLSLGITADTPYADDPLVKAANAVVKNGISIVAAAGNNGPSRCSINSPGTSPYVITVGAADFSKTASGSGIKVANFSSRGPTAEGLPKPDLLAAGVGIHSLDYRNPKAYAVQTGTSMAAPAVSGVAACLYALRPDLTPMQVKRLITRSAFPMKPENRSAQGCGLLNYEILLDF